MADNSYAQLIDDFDAGIQVLEGETLTEYIKRMGGVDYNAHGGSVGIEVLFNKKDGGRIGLQTGGTSYDPRASVQDYANALKSVSGGTTYQQQADAKRYATQQADQMLTNAFKSGNINDLASKFNFNTDPNLRFEKNREGIYGLTQANRENVLKNMANQMLSTTSYASPPPTDPLTGMLQSKMLPNMADGSMKSLAEQNAIRDRVLAAQKAQEESYFLTDPISGKKYSSEDEAIEDLGIVTYNERFADGGRVGFQAGGSGNWWDNLEGEALSIYNSMSAYGASDAEIQSKLQAQNLWSPDGTTTDTEQVTGIINQNIGGGDGGGGGGGTNISPNYGTYQKEYTGMTMPDGTPIGGTTKTTNIGIMDGLKNTWEGIKDFSLSDLPPIGPVGIISRFLKQRSEKQQEIQNNQIQQAQKEREMQQAIKDAEAHQAALNNAQRTGRRPGSGGQGIASDSTGTSYDAGGREGFGYGLRQGGLATMFTRRR